MRCTNRKCKGTLILETSQPTHVARRQVLASGKERNIYDFTESADLSDDTKYGNPHHKHVNTANSRRPNTIMPYWMVTPTVRHHLVKVSMRNSTKQLILDLNHWSPWPKISKISKKIIGKISWSVWVKIKCDSVRLTLFGERIG